MGKITVILIVGLLLVVSFFLVKNVESSGNVIAEEPENLRRVDLSIENMYCEACAYGVKAQIEELDGVVSAEIDYKNANGFALYDASKVKAEKIAEASTVYPASVVGDKKV